VPSLAVTHVASDRDQALADHVAWLITLGLHPAAGVHVQLHTGAPRLRPAFAYIIAAYGHRFRLKIFKGKNWWWYEVHDMAKPKGLRVMRSGHTPYWEATRDRGLWERNVAEQEWAWGGQP
jgi:hypothetical protein